MGFFTPKKIFSFLILSLYWYLFWTMPPLPPFKPSLETTYFTSPLDKDGYVDYAAALNMRQPKLLPEQNAVIPLLSIVGKDCWPSKLDLATFTQLIGEKLPIPMSAKFVSYPAYIKSLATDVLIDDSKINVSIKNNKIAFDKDSEILPELDSDGNVIGAKKPTLRFYNKTSPWDSKEFPLIASWILSNGKAIEAMKKAASCKGFFWPQLSRNNNMHLGQTRLFRDGSITSLIKCIDAQTMGMIHDGNISGAINNIAVTCRVGLFFLGSYCPIDDVVGSIILKRSLLSILPILNNQLFSIGTGEQLLGVLDSLPPTPDSSRALRFEYMILPLARLSEIQKNYIMSDRIEEEPIDFNAICRMTFRHGQMLCKFLEQPTLPERLKKMKEVRDFIETKSERMSSSFFLIAKYLKLYFFTHRWAKRAAISKFPFETLLYVGAPKYDDVYTVIATLREYKSIMRIAIQLRIFKLQHGDYPVSLKEVKESFPNTSLIDSFTDQPLKYRREGDGCILYSVGSDQIDDGGKSDIFKNMDDTSDIIVSLKD